ncbi:MAG: YbaK/EbsC family protein [Deltaproteobacteria bacterium]|nr:YbaK/EbsC family protein [Deltaproteobacteria bacterium]
MVQDDMVQDDMVQDDIAPGEIAVNIVGMDEKPRSTQELDRKGIPYKLVPHENSAHTAEDAAKEIGLELGQIVKSLLVEGHRRGPVLVLVAGDRRIHFGKLGKIVGDKSVFLCSPERTLEVTGYPVGLVTAFGLKRELPMFLDQSVLDREKIAVSSGVWGFEIVLKPADLARAATAEIALFTK